MNSVSLGLIFLSCCRPFTKVSRAVSFDRSIFSLESGHFVLGALFLLPHGFVNNTGELSASSPSSRRACGLKVLTENDPPPLCCRCPGTWNSTHHHHQTAEALHLRDLQQWQVRGVTYLASASKGESGLGGWGEWGVGAWVKATSTELLC